MEQLKLNVDYCFRTTLLYIATGPIRFAMVVFLDANPLPFPECYYCENDISVYKMLVLIRACHSQHSPLYWDGRKCLSS